ncbi:alpha/beta fold hydrolase [soil metagenome]
MSQLLFCFPNGGGTSSVYAGWTAALLPAFRVRRVVLPGRETLADEAPLTGCGELVARLLSDLVPHVSQPYAIFGHSMGALVGYEIACALRDAGHPEPTSLVVSACPAPGVPRRARQYHAESEEALVDLVRTMGGVPEEILASREYLDFMLPLLRADLQVLETYQFTPRSALSCPIVVLGGQADPICVPGNLDAWHSLTTGPCQTHLLPGGHFYLFEQRQAFLDVLQKQLVR